MAAVDGQPNPAAGATEEERLAGNDSTGTAAAGDPLIDRVAEGVFHGDGMQQRPPAAPAPAADQSGTTHAPAGGQPGETAVGGGSPGVHADRVPAVEVPVAEAVQQLEVLMPEGAAAVESQQQVGHGHAHIHPHDAPEQPAAAYAAHHQPEAAQQQANTQQAQQQQQEGPAEAQAAADAAGGASLAASQAAAAVDQPSRAAQAAAARPAEDDAAARAAAQAAERAEAQAAELRERRLKAAEAELQRAEDLVGWAAEEEGVDVARGISLLQAMFARLDAHVDEALGESATRRRTFTPPPPPPPPPTEEAAAAAGDGVAAAPDVAPSSAAPRGSDSQGASAASASPAGTMAGDGGAGAHTEALAGASGGVEQPLSPARASLDHGQHPELAPLSDAAFTLAALLSTGLAAAHGLPRNDGAAVYALHRSALAGSIEARLALAERYVSGRGVPRLVEQGMGHAKVAGPELLALLDDSGNINSEGGGHLRRKWMDPSYLPASNIFEDANQLHMEQDAATRGSVEARRQLGFRMLMGQGLPRDLAGAWREFQVAARAGDAYAMYNLGWMHVRGMHVAQNYTLARKHFLEAAAEDLPSALNALGVLYFHGQGVEVNMSEALRYFQAAAPRDHDAAYNLGTMYQGGYAVDRNMSRAVELFGNATAAGSWRAPHQLFMVHADGLYGAPKNHTAALASFWHFLGMTGGWKEAGKVAAERAAEGDGWGAAVRYALLAEQGNSLAQLNLAWLLHRGVIPSPDRHRLALGLWLRAAARNQTEGMLMAGHVLRRGDEWGLEGGANLTRAVELYEKAAGAGSIEGLYTMGTLREAGLGVARNVSEAMRLYSRAVQTAPYECYATAPFVALWWLRLRLLLGPLLRLLAARLPPVARPVSGRHAEGRSRNGAAAVAWGGRSGGVAAAQWDTLAIAAMVGLLTWVLWRKRQLSRRDSQPSSASAAPPPAMPAAAAAAAAADARVRVAVAAAAAASAPGLRHRSTGGAAAEAEEDALPDAPPNPRL